MKSPLILGIPCLAVGIALLAFWGMKWQATTFVAVALFAVFGGSLLSAICHHYDRKEDREFSRR
jgi:membrane protein implicated in regulation of membrane protease activity